MVRAPPCHGGGRGFEPLLGRLLINQLTMNKYEYGTTEYYREYFSDVISDVAVHDDIEQNQETISNIMNGFKQAVEQWIAYHSASAASHKELLNQFNQFEEEIINNQ